MKSRITKTVALAALMVGTAGVANATEGWYGRADIGYSAGGHLDIESSFPGFGGEPETDSDWSQYLGLGYSMGNGFRLEGELSHRFNELDAEAGNDLGGDVHAWAAMFNLYYDFAQDAAAQPYIGVGVGAARLNANAHDSGGGNFDDSDTVFAWQALVGINFNLTEQLGLDVGYRYFQANDAEFEGTPLANSPYSGDYNDQAVTVGLRWQFAAAPPPPAPPPPPPAYVPPPPPPPPVATCPTSEFVVYFEWDRSNLNQAAIDTIDAAVERARQCNVSGTTVVGHTDTSGSAQYNLGLSERRAGVVRDALVARGLNGSSITTQARGETDLARATRDGVREPLNRRTAVTITFQ